MKFFSILIALLISSSAFAIVPGVYETPNPRFCDVQIAQVGNILMQTGVSTKQKPCTYEGQSRFFVYTGGTDFAKCSDSSCQNYYNSPFMRTGDEAFILYPQGSVYTLRK